jgi:hypothetical protein
MPRRYTAIDTEPITAETLKGRIRNAHRCNSGILLADAIDRLIRARIAESKCNAEPDAEPSDPTLAELFADPQYGFRGTLPNHVADARARADHITESKARADIHAKLDAVLDAHPSNAVLVANANLHLYAVPEWPVLCSTIFAYVCAKPKADADVRAVT